MLDEARVVESGPDRFTFWTRGLGVNDCGRCQRAGETDPMPFELFELGDFGRNILWIKARCCRCNRERDFSVSPYHHREHTELLRRIAKAVSFEIAPTTYRLSVTLMFAWYDFWVGLYYDRSKRDLYVFPVPMLGLKISLRRKSRLQIAIQFQTG